MRVNRDAKGFIKKNRKEPWSSEKKNTNKEIHSHDHLIFGPFVFSFDLLLEPSKILLSEIPVSLEGLLVFGSLGVCKLSLW